MPYGYVRSPPFEQASYHSPVAGVAPPLQRRFPDHAQYAYAAHHVIRETGTFGPPMEEGMGAKVATFAHDGGSPPSMTPASTLPPSVAPRKSAYSAFVTSVESMQNVPAKTIPECA